MVLLLERSKLVVEGAGAVAVAALMHGRVEAPASGDVCAVLSGGNVDASLLSECIRLGETAAGRRMVLSTVVPDRPGALAGLLRVVAEHGGNVVDVEHLRDGIDLHVRETAIKLVLQTRGHREQPGDPRRRARRGLLRARGDRRLARSDAPAHAPLGGREVLVAGPPGEGLERDARPLPAQCLRQLATRDPEASLEAAALVEACAAPPDPARPGEDRHRHRAVAALEVADAAQRARHADAVDATSEAGRERKPIVGRVRRSGRGREVAGNRRRMRSGRAPAPRRGRWRAPASPPRRPRAARR